MTQKQQKGSIIDKYNSIVRIVCQTVEFNWLHPYQKDNTYKSYGSGFFITDKYFLTCAHVIDEAQFIHFQVPKLGEKLLACRVKGMCPELDIAILESMEYRSSVTCELEKDQDIVQPGDKCQVMGYPLGQSNLKITEGIISGQQLSCYQIDAPINHGNSGGPLFRNGKVIGIAKSIITGQGTQNVGYARPIFQYFLIEKALLDSKKKNPIIYFPETFGFLFQHLNIY